MRTLSTILSLVAMLFVPALPGSAQDDPLLGVGSAFRAGHAGELYAGRLTMDHHFPEMDAAGQYYDGDRLFFHPCHSTLSLPISDSSGQLLEAFSNVGGPDGEVFAIVEGLLSTNENRREESFVGGGWLIADALWRMEPLGEGFNCPTVPSRLIWRVYGNEPFWNIELGPFSMAWSEPGVGPLQFSVETLEERESVWRYSGTPYESAAPVLSVDIEALPGHDSMSGAWAPCTARVNYGERSFTGWAVPQDPQAEYTYVGSWICSEPDNGADLPPGHPPGSVTLVLDADFTASLVFAANSNRTAPANLIEWKGQWRAAGARSVEVELEPRVYSSPSRRLLDIVQHPDGSLYCGGDSLVWYGMPGSLAGTGFER